MTSRTPTSLRLALRELRSHFSTRLGAVTILALTLVPSIYAGLYLYANHDPYGGLDRVPAALVVSDRGTTTSDGRDVEAGNEVAAQLLEQGDFDWQRVDAADARSGVAHGDYDFALVIPPDFSAALTSSAGSDPHQAQLRMVTNDANSYLSTTIANTVITKVREAISERVSAEATSNFLLGISDVRKELVQGAAGAGTLHQGIDKAGAGAERLAAGLDTMAAKVAPLPDKTAQLASGAGQVADGNARIAATGDRVADAVRRVRSDYAANRNQLIATMKARGLNGQQRGAVLSVYDRVGGRVTAAEHRVGQLSGDLDRLADGARQVADGNRAMADAMPALVDGMGSARDGAGTVSAGLEQLSQGSAQLTKSLRQGATQVPVTNTATRQRIAETVSNPVAIDSSSQAQARTYGDGLAPFFLALATWIGAYVLFIVLRPVVSGREAEKVHGWRAALAGWLPSAVVAAAQASLMVLVVAFGLGISPANLPSTWLFLLLIAVVFTAIVHAFTVWLGQPGQFLALVLMVLQLVTAGGTFPWQTIPQPLHWLHEVLPMTYAVDGLRLIMYGAPSWRLGTDVLVLMAWGGAALAVSLLVGTRRGAPVAQPSLTSLSTDLA